MTNLAGRRLGRYQVQEQIGRGGMAVVYKALDTTLQRTVALKVLAPHLAGDPEFAERFQREAITAANLHHPNIVLIFDVAEQDGVRYIAMEFVEGRTLYAIIQERGSIDFGLAVAIIGQVGAALDYAHRRGAVHRDVKPHNIMIDVGGRVLLTDFGIAQAPEREDSERLTRTGVFMGTPEYISPEQASALHLDGRSDLYSLGITTYEMLTGRVPFTGATPRLIVAHIQESPPPPSSFDAELPPELDAVMARILAKKPENRFDSAGAFTEALRIVARKRGHAPTNRAQIAALATPRTPAAEPPVAIADARPIPRPSTGVPTHRAPPVEVGPPAVPVRPQTVAPRPKPTSPPVPPRGGDTGVSWTVAGPILAAIFLALAFFLFRNTGAENPFTPTAVPTPAPVATLRPTLAPTATPTPTPTPSATPTVAPSATSQPTAAPPVVIDPVPPVIPSAIPEPPTPEPPTPEPPAIEVSPTTEVLPTAEVVPTVAATIAPVPTAQTAPTTVATAATDAPVPSVAPPTVAPVATPAPAVTPEPTPAP